MSRPDILVIKLHINKLETLMKRPSGRTVNELRTVKITRNYTRHAEGSVLVEFGDTKVLCNASVAE